MRIGELATRTGASVRSLRHYETNGLLSAERTSNGYREFPECAVEAVSRIRALLAAGLPVATIRKILPCVLTVDLKVSTCDGLVDLLQTELRKIDAQTADLNRARAAISGMLSG